MTAFDRLLVFRMLSKYTQECLCPIVPLFGAAPAQAARILTQNDVSLRSLSWRSPFRPALNQSTRRAAGQSLERMFDASKKGAGNRLDVVSAPDEEITI